MPVMQLHVCAATQYNQKYVLLLNTISTDL